MPRHGKLPTRLFVDAPLNTSRLELSVDQAHYLGRVLRCRAGDVIVVFNAKGHERRAVVESLARRRSSLALGDAIEPLPESPARVVLLQALAKSDAMDLIVQKATELGAAEILAARTQFSVVKLDADRISKKLAHWRRIAVSACEQSGRHRPPEISLFRTLDAATAALPAETTRVALDVGATEPLDTVTAPSAALCIAVGPEGGFSDTDRELLRLSDFSFRAFGPRTLRAETAAVAAMACAQLIVGDLGRAGA